MAGSRDPHHDAQLLRDLQIINARTVAELGPLPPGGLPVEAKRKPRPWRPMPSRAPAEPWMEDDEMKRTDLAAALALSAAGVVAACGADGEPQSTGVIGTTAQKEQALPAPDTNGAVRQARTQGVAPKMPTDSHHGSIKVPAPISAFVKPDDILLAYQTMDLTGDGYEDAVLIVRHPVPDGPPDYRSNPCDLLILHGADTGLVLGGRSSKAVDCTFTRFTREEAQEASDLNDILNLKPSEVSCYNERERGGSSTFTFAYSKDKKSWHLARVAITYSRSNEERQTIDVFDQVATYPKDIGWIPMSDFDPADEELRRTLSANEALSE